MSYKYTVTFLIVFLLTFGVSAQSTVFNLFKSNLKTADQYFDNGKYREALQYYKTIEEKGNQAVRTKIALCHYLLKEYDQAAKAYAKLLSAEKELTPSDRFYAAETYTALGQYENAIAEYKRYLAHVPEDKLVMKKMWQLSNRHYLYEDSVHFGLHYLNFNSQAGDLCFRPLRDDRMLLMSNRSEGRIIQRVDARSQQGFYKLYQLSRDQDSLGIPTFTQLEPIAGKLNKAINIGPAALFDGANKLVFAASGDDKSPTLKIYFASWEGEEWVQYGEFPYNSDQYTCSEPSISDDGSCLFFSSDMPGGQGGRDIYIAEFKDGQWSKPRNLGEIVNSRYDETFPYYHDKHTLYFSSSGHPGLGGMDIFKTELQDSSSYGEPVNMGYPINSQADDFGIFLDSLNTHGYITSNRRHGGYDDDIYSVDIDIQIYPVEVSGVVKVLEQKSVGIADPQPLPQSRLELIDVNRNIAIASCVTDNQGNFNITIPYYSKYKLKVVSKVEGHHWVSFEVPKYKGSLGAYEIVIVKDDFQQEY